MLLAIVACAVGWQPPQQPLSGPAVRVSDRAGLVRHDMNGRVIRPEQTIEAAAVEKLNAAPEVRARVERVLVERAAAIDRFVVENLFLLNQLQTVQAAGSLRDKVVLGVTVVTKIGESIKGQKLSDAVAGSLPEADAAKFRAMLRDYWMAVYEEGRALKPHGPPAPWMMYVGESLASLGREIARSFERQSASGTLFVDSLVAGLDLTESQQQIIRDLKLDLLEKTNMRPTEEDQKLLILGAAAYLNQDQRAKVIARVAGKK